MSRGRQEQTVWLELVCSTVQISPQPEARKSPSRRLLPVEGSRLSSSPDTACVTLWVNLDTSEGAFLAPELSMRPTRASLGADPSSASPSVPPPSHLPPSETPQEPTLGLRQNTRELYIKVLMWVFPSYQKSFEMLSLPHCYK